jgi:hypothetical protein
VLYHFQSSKSAGDSMEQALIYNERQSEWRAPKMAYNAAFISYIRSVSHPKSWATALSFLFSIIFNLISLLVHQWKMRSYTIRPKMTEGTEKWLIPER